MRPLLIAVLTLLFSGIAGAAAVVTVAPDLPTGEVEHYYTAPVDYPTELILFGTYRPAENSGGVISVNVGAGTAPLVLLLSSYETALWDLHIAAGASIQRIILNGYQTQQISGAGAVPVTNLSPSNNWLGAYAWDWPYDADDGGSDTQLLVTNAQNYTGLTLQAFAGSGDVFGFTVAAPEPTCLPCAGALLSVALSVRRRKH